MARLSHPRSSRWALALGALVVLLTVLLSPSRARASEVGPEPALAEGEEAPDSPRASLRQFLELGRQGRWDAASYYLDVPRGEAERRADLARRVDAVLAERVPLTLDDVSGQAQGRRTDGLASFMEEVGRLKEGELRTTPVRLVRREARPGEEDARWVFSQQTVTACDRHYDTLEDRWIRERLPPVLQRRGPKNLTYWQWLALGPLALLAYSLGRLLASLTRRVLVFASRRETTRLVAGQLTGPLTLAWGAALVAAAIFRVPLGVGADDFVNSALRALVLVALFWAVARALVVFVERATLRAAEEKRQDMQSVATLATSLGRVVLATLAVLLALSELGYNVAGIVTGIGIGGVALALAAQKTVENVFGSLSLVADGAIRVGDLVQVDGVLGTVERIGMRSTRIRTAERTVVIFPNGKLSELKIDAHGARDAMLLKCILPIARATDVAVLERLLAALRTAIAERKDVLPDSVSVQLVSIGKESFDVELFVHVDTRDFATFRRVREALLLDVVRAIGEHGAALAYPLLETRGAAV